MLFFDDIIELLLPLDGIRRNGCRYRVVKGLLYICFRQVFVQPVAYVSILIDQYQSWRGTGVQAGLSRNNGKRKSFFFQSVFQFIVPAGLYDKEIHLITI